MPHMDREKQELLLEIQALGYERLRYSIFNDHRPGEWEVRIEFDNELNRYLVYATMDRASYTKKLEFGNFKDAKACFMEKLELTIKTNRISVKMGKTPEYSSPLWDKVVKSDTPLDEKVKKLHQAFDDLANKEDISAPSDS